MKAVMASVLKQTNQTTQITKNSVQTLFKSLKKQNRIGISGLLDQSR